MNILRRLWRRLFPQPAPTPTPTPPPNPPRGWHAWDKVLATLAPPEEPLRIARGYVMPEILPGVLPAKLPTAETGLMLAMDGGYQEIDRVTMATDDGGAVAPAAWGFGDSSAFGPGVTFLGFPFLAELAQITEYRTPAESLSNEMTRTWLRLKSKGKQEKSAAKITEITERLEQLKIRDLFREAALKTEQFGRAHIYVSIRGQDDDKSRQLPLEKIKQGDLIGFTCVEPYWLTPYSWNATHPERPDFYRPQSWFMLGRKTHRTRLLTFIFREVPDLLKPAYNFAGISMTQLMLPYVQRWLRTAKSVNDLINIFSIVTLSTDLQSMLQAPDGDPTGLVARLRAFTQMRDNRGLMAVNKTTEELSMQNVPLGSLDKLQAQAQEHMATPGRMPLIKFFGITPTGLNAGSDGEFQSWYDYVRGLQRLGFDANFEAVLALVQMDMYGEVDSDITHEWLPLFEPTPKEIAENRKADTDRDGNLIDKGVVSPAEVREKLKADPTSGYDGLEGEPPEPPEPTEPDPQETSVDVEE